MVLSTLGALGAYKINRHAGRNSQYSNKYKIVNTRETLHVQLINLYFYLYLYLWQSWIYLYFFNFCNVNGKVLCLVHFASVLRREQTSWRQHPRLPAELTWPSAYRTQNGIQSIETIPQLLKVYVPGISGMSVEHQSRSWCYNYKPGCWMRGHQNTMNTRAIFDMINT